MRQKVFLLFYSPPANNVCWDEASGCSATTMCVDNSFCTHSNGWKRLSTVVNSQRGGRVVIRNNSFACRRRQHHTRSHRYEYTTEPNVVKNVGRTRFAHATAMRFAHVPCLNEKIICTNIFVVFVCTVLLFCIGDVAFSAHSHRSATALAEWPPSVVVAVCRRLSPLSPSSPPNSN